MKKMTTTEVKEQIEWTKMRVDLAMEGEGLYDICFDCLKNHEIMLMTMFILWVRDNDRDLKARANLVPPEREKILTGGGDKGRKDR